jgi:hypothetical protein
MVRFVGKDSIPILLEFKANRLPGLIHVHAYFILSYELSLLIMLSACFCLLAFITL